MNYAPCVSPSVAADVLSVVTECSDCPELDSLVLGGGVGSMVTATCIGLAAAGCAVRRSIYSWSIRITCTWIV